jgi:hypothetical protein
MKYGERQTIGGKEMKLRHYKQLMASGATMMLFLLSSLQPLLSAEKKKAEQETQSGVTTLTVVMFSDGSTKEITITNEMLFITAKGGMAAKVPGEFPIAITHFLDPQRKPIEQEYDLGATSTTLSEAEAYTERGKLRTSEHEPMVGIQGKGVMELHFMPSASGNMQIIPNIEAPGLTFKNSFKKSKVKIIGQDWSNVVLGVVREKDNPDGTKTLVFEVEQTGDRASDKERR